MGGCNTEGRIGETKQRETDCDGRWKEEGSSAGSNDRWCMGGLTLRMTAGLCGSDLMRMTWTDFDSPQEEAPTDH